MDVYEDSWKTKLLPKQWLRPITRRVPQQRLFAALQRWVPRLFPVSCEMARVPVVGQALKWLVPVANYTGKLPLTKQQQLEWSLLDTFDWYAPAYDSPQTARTTSSVLIGAIR